MVEVSGGQYNPVLPQPLRQSYTVNRFPPEPAHCNLYNNLSGVRRRSLRAGLLGCDVLEQPEHINSAFKVIETQRLRLTCSCCDHIVQTAMLIKPIQRSYTRPYRYAEVRRAHVLLSPVGKYRRRGTASLR